MSDPVIPRWELHIQPMFCLLDRYHMIGYNINFDDVQSVWNHRQPILSHVQGGSMPPPNENGPWPKEMVQLLARWITAGEQLFDGHPPALSLASGSGYSVSLQFGTLQVLGQASLPYKDSKAWFQIMDYSKENMDLKVYLENPPSPVSQTSQSGVQLSLNVDKIGTTPEKVTITDENGTQSFPTSASVA